MFDDVIHRRKMSRGFRCALFGVAMTVLARLGPWRWPGWPALTVLDFVLARFSPSVVGPVEKGIGLVVLLIVNVSFWGALALLAVRARSFFLAAALLLSLGCSVGSLSSTGVFRAPDGSLIELHVSPDQQIRGYLREGARVAALSSVRRSGSMLNASAVYDDGTRGEIAKRVELIAAEKPATADVRREIEGAYEQLARAVERKDFEAFQALRVADFAAIPPDGVPSSAARMAERARGLLERIQPPITTRNDILELTTRGDEAIATVRQKFTRRLIVENKTLTVHTEVTQRETWRKTADGWKLTLVDEVRDQIRQENEQDAAQPR